MLSNSAGLTTHSTSLAISLAVIRFDACGGRRVSAGFERLLSMSITAIHAVASGRRHREQMGKSFLCVEMFFATPP